MLGFGENNNKEVEDAKETGDMGNLDPMSDAPLANPHVEPEAPEEIPDVIPSETPAKSEPTPEDIASRLESDEVSGQEEVEQEGKPQAERPKEFDLSQFSPETLQALKRMLNATPDRPTNKKDGISIQLREIDGKILRDFSKAFNGYITDPEEPTRKIAVPKIKVWLFGQEEPVEMQYEHFMQAERKKFKVHSTRREVKEVEEGETTSNETGQLVTMIATYHTQFFTIEVDGKKVEISDKIANA